MDAALIDDLHTIDEIEALPEGRRAELIDGYWYDMASPTVEHQLLIGEIYRKIANHIEARGGDCVPVMAPLAVYLNNDKYNYIEPDLSIICDKNKLDKDGCHGAPDWIIEVVSPSSRRMDYMIKMRKYGNAGVSLYWIVDPDKRIVRVLDYKNDDTMDYTFDDIVPVSLYPDLEMDFAKITAEI